MILPFSAFYYILVFFLSDLYTYSTAEQTSSNRQVGITADSVHAQHKAFSNFALSLDFKIVRKLSLARPSIWNSHNSVRLILEKTLGNTFFVCLVITFNPQSYKYTQPMFIYLFKCLSLKTETSLQTQGCMFVSCF